MRSSLIPLPLIPLLLMLGSCGSAPKLPSVDVASKRPANSAVAVELQVCASDLHNTRIRASESGRRAETAGATLERLSARWQAIVASAASAAGEASKAAEDSAARTASTNAVSSTSEPTLGNRLFTIHFEFNRTNVVVPAEIASLLIQSARAAPLVLLRGRTDGITDSAAEDRIARERAAAVRDYLIAAGIDPARIRATYQPTGDRAAENASAAGRQMNRRVEIEVYRVLPVVMGSAVVATY